MKTSQLYLERMQTSWSQAARIIRTVFSGGGTPLFVGILLIALYFGYRRFLEWLPADFPLIGLLSFLLSLFLTSSRVRTWLKPPDLVFLLPMEARLTRYFRASLVYSSIIHLIHLALFMGLAYPLYLLKVGSLPEFWLSLLVLGLIQIGNVLIGWYEVRLTDVRSPVWLWSVKLFRWGVNWGLSFLILWKNWLWLIPGLLILGTWLFYMRFIMPPFPYPWTTLLKREQQTLSKYYAMARWFVDLPQIETPVKRRKWLIGLLDRLLPRQSPFSYLYWRSFLRQSELFGIYLRLIGWAMLMTLLLPNVWVSLVVLLLSLWMFADQLPEIAHPGQYPIWVKLYPIATDESKKSLVQMGWVLLGLQGLFIFLVISFLPWVPLVWLFGIGGLGLLAVLLMSSFYLPRQLSKFT